MTIDDVRSRVARGVAGARALVPRRFAQAGQPGQPHQTRPQPPRRAPSRTPPIELTPGERFARASLAIVAALMIGFLLSITLVSQLQHAVAQQQLGDEFRALLSEGTAPVSEGDVDGVLLADGDPVAYLQIPSLGVHEIVVEGTDSGTLKAGPGHRRDTVLPGQEGTSVIMARAAAYGGPFSRLQELQPGQNFSIVTGQGEFTYAVIGVRYAGDPSPAAAVAGESRLVLETARGVPYIPEGVVRVDAELTASTQPAGLRQTTPVSLPASHRELASDYSTVWALVFALQLLIVIEIAAVWSFRRIGPRKTWVVFVPLTLLGGILVADQVTRLLPNLL